MGDILDDEDILISEVFFFMPFFTEGDIRKNIGIFRLRF